MKKILLSIVMVSLGFISKAQSTVAVGATCPDITITDSKGIAHNLYTYCNQGKYVLVDFFAFWCGPCMQAAPNIEAFYKKYGCNSGDVIVLGNESDASGTLATLHDFDSIAGLSADTYPAGFGKAGTNAANANLYGVSAFPTIILVGPDKKMINKDVWPVSTVGQIESAFSAGSINPKSCSAPMAINSINQDVISSFIAPNPATASSVLHLNLSKNVIIAYQLVDLFGKVIYTSNNTTCSAGSTNINIPLNSIASGLYIVNVLANENKYASFKLKVD